MGISKTRISAEESEDVIASVTFNDWFQYTLPVISTMNIAIAKKCSLRIAILIDTEQRMIAGALEVAVVGRAFLICHRSG